ncbi:MAG: ATP-binding protein [Clostridiales Family XIII bacterium]|nr:ATP-binding protein [Clostridiales Family XIII bacterium]
MYDFQARKIIESLRSGIPSHDVGLYFSSARPKIMAEIQQALDAVSDTCVSGGRIVSGKYGEGKSHLLNTVFNIAQSRNMVVSMVTLSKETPLSNLSYLYAKILQGTYLPGYRQPGILPALEQLSLTSPVTQALLEFSLTHLETNKLYYVVKSLLGTQDDDEKYLLGSDIEGDFIASSAVRKTYRRVFGEPAAFNKNFVKSRHITDYIAFLSKLFVLQGYAGWVILFDEAELIGRLGRKSRHKAYLNMNLFLEPKEFQSAYSIFAFNASFVPDVIDAKHEYEHLEDNANLFPEMQGTIRSVLANIESATQLAPLSREETSEILGKILQYHGAAYGWSPSIDPADFMRATDPYGYLLRTRIRAAVEMLDQLFQYGKIGEIKVTELGQITFDDEDEASLREFV